MISGKLRLGSFFLFLFACADAPTTFSHFRSVFNWTGRLHFSGESALFCRPGGYACGRDSRIRTASSESIFSTSFFSSATFFFRPTFFITRATGGYLEIIRTMCILSREVPVALLGSRKVVCNFIFTDERSSTLFVQDCQATQRVVVRPKRLLLHFKQTFSN